MNPELLALWIDSKKRHLSFCQELGVLYTKESLEDQFKLLDQLTELAQLDPQERFTEFELIS